MYDADNAFYICSELRKITRSANINLPRAIYQLAVSTPAMSDTYA